MSQLDIISFNIVVSYLFLYFFFSLIVADLFQIMIFGIFRFSSIKIYPLGLIYIKFKAINIKVNKKKAYEVKTYLLKKISSRDVFFILKAWYNFNK